MHPKGALVAEIWKKLTDSNKVDLFGDSSTRWAKMLNKKLTLFTIKLTLKDTDKIIGIFFYLKIIYK